MEETLIKPKHKYSEYLKSPYSNLFFISPDNSDQVLSVIKELNNNKSTGPSSMPSKFLKLMPHLQQLLPNFTTFQYHQYITHYHLC